jgi:Sec7-like guanine-nucleotide exchange factor
MSKLPLDRKENLFYFVELLKFCNRISEQKMIEILGYHKEECVYIMEAYVASFNFHNLTVEEGLRLLLSNFLLFGES